MAKRPVSISTDIPAEERKRKREELRQWLVEQFDRIREGKKPEMNTDLREKRDYEPTFDGRQR